MIKGLSYIKDNIDKFKEAVIIRGLNSDFVEELKTLIGERTTLIPKLDEKRGILNQKSSQGVPDENLRTELKSLSDEISELEKKQKKIEEKLEVSLSKLPNLVSPDSPEGGEENFEVIRKWGEIPKLNSPKDHEQIGKELNLIDFEAGVKVAGNKFYYLKNEAVLLEFALIQYALDILSKEGFTPFVTPQIVKNEILESIGFVPRGPEKQVYGVDEEGLSLIGTSEVTLGGYHKDEIIDVKKLPLKYAGFSTCFRTEAGAYGKHSKGLYRVHQFDKLEMFIFCLPQESEKMHDYLLSIEEKIFQGLNIPYRVINIAVGDLGASAYKKYDLEAWMPGRGDYGEITSTSNTTNYQSLRLNIKYQDGEKKDFVHTLNGTAVAISRVLIAILENFQQEDGSILIPEVLQKYTGFKEIRVKEKLAGEP